MYQSGIKNLFCHILIVLAFIASNDCAQAFKTGYGYTPVHAQIIKEALEGIGFSRASLKKIREGADSQDKLFSKKFLESPSHHFDDNLIEESIKYFRGRFNSVVSICRNAHKSEEKRNRALYVFGEGLHTVQDFYSHSNYPEMLARAGGPYKIINWDKLPSRLTTGFFYYDSAYSNEMTESRDTCVRNIFREIRDARFVNLSFHTSEEWKARIANNATTLQQLDYALAPNHHFIHHELNKDDNNSPAGKVRLADGRTMHQVARSLAVKETVRQWKRLRKSIKSIHKKRAQLIIPALKGHTLPYIGLSTKVPGSVKAGSNLKGRVIVRISNAQDKFDIVVRVRIFNTIGKRSTLATMVQRTLKYKSNGDYSVEFESPISKRANACRLKIDARFAGDAKFRNKKLVREIRVTETEERGPRREPGPKPRPRPRPRPSPSPSGSVQLQGSEWSARGHYGADNWGTCSYTVKVLNADPTLFQLRILGHKPGNKPEIFYGRKTGANFVVEGQWWGHEKFRKGPPKPVTIRGTISPDGTSARGTIQGDIPFDAVLKR